MTTTEPAPVSATNDEPPALAPAVTARLDATIARLVEGEKVWAELSLAGRVELLDRVHASTAASARHWVASAVAVKKLDLKSPLVGEEWMSGPYSALSMLLALKRSLSAIVAGGSPVDGLTFGTAPGGRVTVPVLPATPYDAMLLNGFSAEVWLKPGVTPGQVKAQAGLGALTPTATDGVGLVLGAGNITSIPALDVLYELFAHNRVVLLKLNPVMDGMFEAFSGAFAPLIKLGVLAIVKGGGEVGGYLTQHPSISHVHITGSALTHDVIVWGKGEDAAARKKSRKPLLTKPITSELGGVSPIIVVPGEWTKADLAFQAEHVATQRLHNGGYNCIAGQIVVLSKDWPQKEAFLEQLRIALAAAPDRVPWYPGSDDRIEQACEAYPNAERLGTEGARLLVDIHADEDASTISSTEYFAPVLGVVELAGTAQNFLDAAVETVNTEFVGTLGANVLIAPATLKALGTGFDDAIARLEYGTIAINAWTGVGFLTAGAPWGAFPGGTIDDVQSGIGVVHNSFLLAETERAIIRGPFRPFPRSVAGGELALFPKPPWFVSAKTARTSGRLLSGFAAKPSWLKMPGIFLSAFRG